MAHGVAKDNLIQHVKSVERGKQVKFRNEYRLADFKYGVTLNTHGNTNGSVYPSPLTQSKLTSRLTQMLAMVLHV